MSTSDQQGNAGPPPPAGGPMNQFGFPADPPGYPAPGRTTTTTHSAARRGGGGGSNVGTWLVVGIVALALVGGGWLLFRNLGKTAQTEADTVVRGIQHANDTDTKQALINASNAEETWFTDNQTFSMKGPVVGISTTSHVDVWSSANGYCLRAYSAKGSAQGPANGLYLWYDSQGGGLQPQASATPPKTLVDGTCVGATSFQPLN